MPFSYYRTHVASVSSTPAICLLDLLCTSAATLIEPLLTGDHDVFRPRARWRTWRTYICFDNVRGAGIISYEEAFDMLA